MDSSPWVCSQATSTLVPARRVVPNFTRASKAWSDESVSGAGLFTGLEVHFLLEIDGPNYGHETSIPANPTRILPSEARARRVGDGGKLPISINMGPAIIS